MLSIVFLLKVSLATSDVFNNGSSINLPPFLLSIFSQSLAWLLEEIHHAQIRTAQRYLRDLEELGFIQSKRRKGYNTTIFYEPTDKAKELFKVAL